MPAIIGWGGAATIGASAHEGGDLGTGDEGGDGDNGQSKSEALAGNVGEDDGNEPVDDMEELVEEAADKAADEAADDKDDVEYFITDDRDDSDNEGN